MSFVPTRASPSLGSWAPPSPLQCAHAPEVSGEPWTAASPMPTQAAGFWGCGSPLLGDGAEGG